MIIHIRQQMKLLALSSVFVSAVVLAQPQLSKAPTSVWYVNDQHTLFNIHPDQPDKVLKQMPIRGIMEGDHLIGIDFRVARGELYALANTGRIYTINLMDGAATLVMGSDVVEQVAQGPYGFDFNPAADKLRVVGNHNKNLRLNPDNGQLVDFDKATASVETDPDLKFDPMDTNANQHPDIVAAAYTYNSKDSKLTTNYAIDRRLGVLVMQGTKEGMQPAVSPNLGTLYTVGSLGLGALKDASFDISDIGNIGLAAILPANKRSTDLYHIDLDSGAAHRIGILGKGDHVIGMAIEP